MLPDNYLVVYLQDEHEHLKMLMQINEIYYDWNTDGLYHISDMFPVALPQHRAGAGLTRSLFPVPRTQIVQYPYVPSLSSINSVIYHG